MLAPLISKAQKYLESSGLENPNADVMFLLSVACGVPRSQLLSISSLTPAQKRKFNRYILKRVKRIPVAYIIGEWDFMGFT
ncbi:MAG: hypothetical protein FWC85_02330, partial [Elusimicrobia bacterium]|nr:hypothetical protein [Elusimicrobiota bacterium]